MENVRGDTERVLDVEKLYANQDDWAVIRSPGKTNPEMPDPPVAARLGGKAELIEKHYYMDGKGCHLVQTAEIAPGNRKYLHRHRYAETVWVVIEGEGEFYTDPDNAVPFKAPAILHSYQWEWHGMGNTGEGPLRYISVEGPSTGRRDATELAE